jgi:hypothetical protein
MITYAVHLPARWHCVCWSPSCCFLLEASIVGSRLHSLLLIWVISFTRLFHHWAVTLFFFFRMLVPLVILYAVLLLSLCRFLWSNPFHLSWFPSAAVISSCCRISQQFRTSTPNFPIVWSCSLHSNGCFIVPLCLLHVLCIMSDPFIWLCWVTLSLLSVDLICLEASFLCVGFVLL